jgi:hypothetical protein
LKKGDERKDWSKKDRFTLLPQYSLNQASTFLPSFHSCNHKNFLLPSLAFFILLVFSLGLEDINVSVIGLRERK